MKESAKNNWQEVLVGLVRKALNDETFKQEFLREPKKIIEEELGEELPPIEFVVHENSATKCHIVLPYIIKEDEMTVEEMELVHAD